MKNQTLLVLAVMLFSVFTLAVFFQITHAGVPDVDTDADVDIGWWTGKVTAYAKAECGIEGNLVNGESFSGHGSATVWLNSFAYSADDRMWARVVKKGWWIFSWLGVEASDPFEIRATRRLYSEERASAAASGWLGAASSNSYDFLVMD